MWDSPTGSLSVVCSGTWSGYVSVEHSNPEIAVKPISPLGSFGLLAFTPHSIPNRGLPLDVLRQYRAIAVSTRYFQTGLAENQAFESNLREISQAQIDLDEIPLIVISEALWNPFLGLADVSEDKARQAQQAWQEMQAELPSLSRHGRQVIAEQSQHYIQFDQPDLVIEAIREMTGSLSR
jgi:hypothetical protein